MILYARAQCLRLIRTNLERSIISSAACTGSSADCADADASLQGKSTLVIMVLSMTNPLTPFCARASNIQYFLNSTRHKVSEMQCDACIHHFFSMTTTQSATNLERSITSSAASTGAFVGSADASLQGKIAQILIVPLMITPLTPCKSKQQSIFPGFHRVSEMHYKSTHIHLLHTSFFRVIKVLAAGLNKPWLLCWRLWDSRPGHASSRTLAWFWFQRSPARQNHKSNVDAIERGWTRLTGGQDGAMRWWARWAD